VTGGLQPGPERLHPRVQGAGAEEGSELLLPGGRMAHSAVLPRLPTALVDACRSAVFQMEDERQGTVGVVSAVRGEGRTSVALGFASVFGQDYGRRVLLVELDFARPELIDRLGLRAEDAEAGMAEVIRGESTLDEVVRPVDEHLFVIVAGQCGEQSPHALGSAFLESSLMAQMTMRYGTVVFDLSPALESTVGPSLARSMDQLLMVVRAAETPTHQVQEAIAALPAEPVVLLNATQSDLPRWLRQWSTR
jgi:Mrp family chromosome partitioning ATPase